MTVTTIPAPPRGVYTPVVTFFHEDESIDYDAITLHVRRLLASGVTGFVVHGSNGEATHLSPEERARVIRHIRTLINEFRSSATIIAGCSANSVRQTKSFISTARSSGADFALVLPPSYWAGAMTSQVIKSFYEDVAQSSELPIVIYNFPSVASNIDITSDLIVELAKANPNIVGVKLTCGNLGKLQRVSAELPAAQFSPFAGKADFMLPGLICGSSGVIAALANVVPKVHVELLRSYDAGDLDKAKAIQADLALADWALLKFGISGVKTACQKWFNYGSGHVRRPLPSVDVSALSGKAIESLARIVALEESLSAITPRI